MSLALEHSYKSLLAFCTPFMLAVQTMLNLTCGRFHYFWLYRVV